MNFGSWLPPVLLAAFAAGLYGIDAKLDSQADERRDMRDRIGRLIRAEEREKIPVAAISLEIGEREKFRYVKFEDRWRLDDASGAVADAEALERLYKSFLEGEGIVHSTDPNRLSEYGFSNAEVIRVLLHGPEVMKKKDRDVRYRCELGKSIPELEGGYVRRDGSSHVWAIDSDPRGIIVGSRRGSLPPMLETTVISRSWLSASGQLAEMRVETAVETQSAPPLVMKLEQLPIQEEEMRQGKDPFRWTVTRGTETLAVDNRTAMSFYSFLLSANYDGLYDRNRAAEFGLGGDGRAAVARLVFVPQAGKACELRVGAPRADGRCMLYNTESGVLVDCAADIAALLIPHPEQLAIPSQDSPWQKFLVAQQAATQSAPSLESPPLKK